jgi:hypothetical protein
MPVGRESAAAAVAAPASNITKVGSFMAAFHLRCDRRMKNAILMLFAIQIKVRVTDIHESLPRIEVASTLVQGVHRKPNSGLVSAAFGFRSRAL